MTTDIPRQIVSLTLIAVGLIAGSASAAEAADEPNNVFRFGVGFVVPHVDASRDNLKANNAPGLFVDYERRLIPWLGLDFQVFYARPSFLVQTQFYGYRYSTLVGVLTGTAGVNFHFLGRSKFDLYLGLSGGYTDFSHAPLSGDGAYTYGGVLGCDIPLGQKGMVFTPSIRYSVTDTTADNGSAPETPVQYDPIVFQLGLGWRF